MTRNEAIELLEKYQGFLYEKGYIDDDYWQDNPNALDKFLGTKWAKENLPIKCECIACEMGQQNRNK